MFLYNFLRLALTWLDFVAAQVLLGFSVGRWFARDWVVLLEDDLFSCVLRVFSRVAAVTSKITHDTNQFALCILLCHYLLT